MSSHLTGANLPSKPLRRRAISVKDVLQAAGLAVAFIVTVGCFRATFTCVDPLIDAIQSNLGVSSGDMGKVTTIPLLMFTAFSMVIRDLRRRRRARGIIVLSLLMIIAGVICRSFLGILELFLGTAVIGIKINAGNMLIPAFVKAHYQDMIGRLTNAYTAMLSVISAVEVAVSVPIEDRIG